MKFIDQIHTNFKYSPGCSKDVQIYKSIENLCVLLEKSQEKYKHTNNVLKYFHWIKSWNESKSSQFFIILACLAMKVLIITRKIFGHVIYGTENFYYAMAIKGHGLYYFLGKCIIRKILWQITFLKWMKHQTLFYK